MHLSVEIKAIAVIAVVVALILWSASAMMEGSRDDSGVQQSVRHH